MNRLALCGLIIVLATPVGLFTGCAAPKPLTLARPATSESRAARPKPATGQLIVYSAWDRFDTLDSEHQKHTPYTILSSASDARTTVARVRNQAGSFGEVPEMVELASGQYWIEARATNVGRVRVPVEIQAGQTAILYLDETTAPAAQSVQETRWVRQPSGPAPDIQKIDVRK